MENLTRKEKERLTRENGIISAAERIFCLKGFDAASMNEIADEAQFTKRTLYQYFESKEDLYYAVVLRGFKKLYSYLTEAYKNEQTGYMKVRQSCFRFNQFYKENGDTIRLISYLGYVRKKTAAESSRQTELYKFNNGLFQTVARMINDGMADGSIRCGLDSDKTAKSLIFLMTGFYSQLSVTGESFTQYNMLNLEEFSLYTIDLMLGTLKNN